MHMAHTEVETCRDQMASLQVISVGWKDELVDVLRYLA